MIISITIIVVLVLLMSYPFLPDVFARNIYRAETGSYFVKGKVWKRNNYLWYLWTPVKKVGPLYIRNKSKEKFYLDDYGFIKVR